MKLSAPLLVVNDIEKSRKFYEELFDFKVVMDFGANIVFDAGFSLQSKESWIKFIGKPENEIIYGGNDSELYFEADNFDDFYEKLNLHNNISFVHGLVEYDWGQRAVRIYDPDKHILEIGESMETVCRRFLSAGMSIEETAVKMQHPVSFVEACLK